MENIRCLNIQNPKIILCKKIMKLLPSFIFNNISIRFKQEIQVTHIPSNLLYANLTE